MWKSLRRQDFGSNEFVCLSAKERHKLFIKAVMIVVLLNACFYRNLSAFVFLVPPGYGYYRVERRALLRQKQEEVRGQFKDMLLLAVAGQRAGYSIENAFWQGYEDLQNLYGKNSSICKMLKEAEAGYKNHISVGDMWKSIGNRSGIVEIKEFAGVFAIAKVSGGNMAAILETAAETIADKTETKQEIAVFLSARRLEQKIMNFMPFGLILYLSLTSPGYFDGLYGTPEGFLVMTFGLLLYIAAYLIGEQIAAVEV